MRFLARGFMGLALSSSALAQSELSCTAFVYGDMPFVTIDMKINPEGHVERLADLTLHGTKRQTAVEENATTANQLYNLTIDADYPGQELYLEIYKPSDSNSDQSLQGKLINPDAPAYKEMRAQCQ